jgi:tetrahydromethanopterin S-methyltransferase subunit E
LEVEEVVVVEELLGVAVVAELLEVVVAELLEVVGVVARLLGVVEVEEEYRQPLVVEVVVLHLLPMHSRQ